MPEQPTIVLPLDLPDVQVLRTEITTDHELLIEVESTLTTTLCRRCGQTISAFYGYDRPHSAATLAEFRLCCVYPASPQALPLSIL